MKKILCVVLMLLVVFSCGANVARAEESSEIAITDLLVLQGELAALTQKINGAIEAAQRTGKIIPFYPGMYRCDENGLKPGTYIFYITSSNSGSSYTADIRIYDSDDKLYNSVMHQSMDPVVFCVTEGQVVVIKYASGYLMKPQF